jgi:hypothetical protein
MAYTGAEGTYLKSTDITDFLAKELVDADAPHVPSCFVFADASVLRVAGKNNVSAGSIRLNDDGSLYDCFLKEYAITAFNWKLYKGYSGAFNFTDTGSLSDSSAYDKYDKMAQECEAQMIRLDAQITPSTITGTATDSKGYAATVDFLRG